MGPIHIFPIMSNLPKLKQEVSEHPSKNAVTAPADPREKEADVDRKMRLYGIISGFREGKLPSNKQIDETLDYFVNTAPFDTSKLSLSPSRPSWTSALPAPPPVRASSAR